MDVNGSPFRLFAEAADFPDPDGLVWDNGRGHLLLAARAERPVLAEDEMLARLLLSRPSPVADEAETYAFWNPATSAIEASGFAPGAVLLNLGTGGAAENPPPVFAPTDMALGADRILYVARDGVVILRDLRDRYPSAVAQTAGFAAHLLAPRPGGGVWALDRTTRRLAVVTGVPLREMGLRDPAPDRFGPVDPNRNPPRIMPLRGAALPAGFEAVAMAGSAGGKLALLAHRSGEEAALFVLEDKRFKLLGCTAGMRFPWSLAWLGEERLALMASHNGAPAAQAFVYALADGGTAGELLPEGRVYPLRQPAPGKFANALGDARYLQALPDGSTGPVRRLIALSGVRYARQGSVLVGPIDSGREGTIWHRLYIEAAVPAHCRIGIAVHAADSVQRPALPGDPDAPDWAPHLVGQPQPGVQPPVTRAAWCDNASELPSAGPLLRCPARPGEAGLFTALIQHAERRVRRVAGRYAWLCVTFEGDSRDSPELAAIRLYSERFSYRDRYLPDMYGEDLAAAEGTAPGPATPPDFLDRLLGLFEGNLTELEGRVAGSWLLTDPAAAPDSALPWIGSWIGIAARRGERATLLRERLRAAPHTARLGGTLGGLLAELELATGGRCIGGGQIDGGAPPEHVGSLVIARFEDMAVRALLLGQASDGTAMVLSGGAVTRGDIVVVECFALRRTFATILGAALADESDPLTLGLSTSGNSYVGDTLILGDAARAELLALFRPEIDATQADTAAVSAFFERLANRVMVLVRGETGHDEMQRLRGIVEAAIPAHIEATLYPASQPLIVGAASLVGIDTYLAEAPTPARVRLEASIIGGGDRISGEGWLDGRADGPMALAPVALANAPERVWRNAPFMISGAASMAARGRRISRYIWTWDP